MEDLLRLFGQHERKTKEDWLDAQEFSTELKAEYEDKINKCVKIMEGLEDQRLRSMKLSQKSSLQHTLSLINIIRADVFDFKKIAQLLTRDQKAQIEITKNPQGKLF